jgi:uncharacterized DUF497 family protein
MNDADFEWDDAKAAQNYIDHGVTFEAARAVFEDPPRSSGLMTARTMARTATSSWAWSMDASFA